MLSKELARAKSGQILDLSTDFRIEYTGVAGMVCSHDG